MSNFGVAFHELLKRINYPGLSQYEPYNFDWFVYQPGLETFLTWIVGNLTDEHVLTNDELERFALLKDEVIENNEERQKLLEVLISLDNGKMAIPWTNYQRNLSEYHTCIKSQTQALKTQLNWKQQQYKNLLMKGPKTKEKIRETRRQIEHLLQLTSPQNLLSLIEAPLNTNQFQQIAMNYLQLERNFLSVLQNTWTDDLPSEQNPNIDLIKQLNHRTFKLVRLEVESALANVEYDTLKSQLQLCGQLKKYFESTSVEDLRKLADRLGTKSNVHQQQRNQYENQLMNVYSSKHEHNLEMIYLNILEKQFQNHHNLYVKQQTIIEGLNQQKHFIRLLETLIDHRLTLVDQTDDEINKIIQYIKNINENLKTSMINKTEKTKSEHFSIDQQMTNPIEKIKTIENDFSKNHSIVHTFVDYINKQSDDFRPKANDLSNTLDEHVNDRLNEWKQLRETISH